MSSILAQGHRLNQDNQCRREENLSCHASDRMRHLLIPIFTASTTAVPVTRRPNSEAYRQGYHMFESTRIVGLHPMVVRHYDNWVRQFGMK